MDQLKIGQIKLDEIIDYSISKIDHNNEYHSFCENVKSAMIGTSEKIILKLKNLRKRSYIELDDEAISDIDWFFYE